MEYQDRNLRGIGTENRLTEEDINRADVVLLITDIELAGAERFTQSRYVQSGISAADGILTANVQYFAKQAAEVVAVNKPTGVRHVFDLQLVTL